eukprot:TRINITY_DN67118_c11_g1_i2.p1 TRINITY_DN67118_c11_g1~~TRINITY_DN67118_c11_g1_i2.p1  ORF type:complete len:498 (+),score=14.50 TRINITY_DN67118_c11_g1_i2:69-1562(+)
MTENTPLLDVHSSETTGTIAGTVINVAKNVIGGGVLAMPFAFSGLGVAGAIVGSFLLFLLTTGTVYLLACAVECIPTQKDSKIDSYSKLTKHAFGPTWCIVGDLITAGYCIGTIIGYAVFLQHFFHDWLENFFGDKTFVDKYWFILIIVFLIESFLLSLRDLEALKYSSMIGTAGLCFAVGSFAFEFFHKFHHKVSPSVQWGVSPLGIDTIKALPMIAFAFAMQYNTPRFYHELPNRTPNRMALLGVYAFGVCGVLYLIAGFSGYLSFGSLTQADITQNYSAKNTLLTVARIGLCMEICSSMPFLNNPLRMIVMSRIHQVFLSGKSTPSSPKQTYSTSVNDDAEALSAQQTLLTGKWACGPFVFVPLWVWVTNMTLTAVEFTVAYFARDHIGAVIDYTSVVFGSWLYFILPGLYFLSLTGSVSFLQREENRHEGAERMEVATWKKGLACLSILVGLVMLVAGVYGNVYSEVNPAPSPPSPAAPVVPMVPSSPKAGFW